MGKQKPKHAKGVILPINVCDLCKFSTKNVYIFKRHRVRCKREKMEETSSTAEREVQEPVSQTSDSAPASSKVTAYKADSAGGTEQPMQSRDRSEGASKTTPTYKKTYRCAKCTFTTTKSKFYLYHLILQHKDEANIFSCSKCEYCSKYKRKIQTHMHMVHKIDIDITEVTVEYIAKSGPPEGIRMDDVMIKSSESSMPSSALTKVKPCKAEGHIVEMRSGPGNVKYKCKYCLFNNPVKDIVSQHVTSKHINMMNVKQFRCPQCDYSTTKKIEFIAHKAEHGNVSTDQHKTVPEPTEYRCGECDYTTYSKLDYDEHKRGHENEVMPYQCNICAFSSDSELAMVRHMSTSHIENADGVEIIIPRAPEDDMDSSVDMDYQGGFNYSTEESFTYPPDSMLGMDSSNISADFDSARSSREGTPTVLKKDHLTRLLANLQTADGTFFCPLCGLKYKRSSDLNRHMKLKHNMKMRQYLLQMKEEEERSGNVSLEERSFGVFSGCEVYVENEADTVSDLQCKYCPFVANSSSELRQHISIHTIESRYKCPVCDKQYKYSGDIHVHLRQDHQIDPDTVQVAKVPIIPNKKSSPAMFRCPTCPYSSHWKADIDRHSKTHKDAKPFQCNNCSYNSHWKGDIRRHVFKHHPEIMKDGVVLEDVITIDRERSREQRSLLEVPRGESPTVQDEALGGSYHQKYDDDEMMDTSSTSIDDGNSSIGRGSMDRSRSTTPLKDSPGGILNCEYCSFQTNTVSKMNAHVSTHVNLKVYMCPVCGRRANWKWDIRKHMRKEHPGVKMEVVKLSRQEAEATIKSYVRTMPVVRREHHLNRDTMVKSSRPMEVDISTSSSSIASNTSAGKSKNYMCAECGFRSNVRGNVNRHIKSIHSGKSVDLIFIPDDINEQEDMEKVGISVPPSQPRNTAQEAKGKGLHIPITAPVSARKSEKPFMCAECGKRCSIKADVRKHYHYIHPTSEIRIMFVDENGATLLPVEDTKAKPPSAIERATAKMLAGDDDFKPFKCGEPNCDKTTNSKGDIKRHYFFMHPGKKVNVIFLGGERREMPAKQPDRSVANVQTAEGLASANPKVFGYIKPFKCTKCGHRSNWKWDLNKHIRSKHPNEDIPIITLSEQEARSTYREYMAGLLSPASATMKKLKLSVIDNQKKKQKELTLKRSTCRQFKCSACPYRSNWRSDLLRHIKRKHGIARAKVQILDAEEAKKSLTEYDYKPKKGKGIFGTRRRFLSGDDRKDCGKIWKCGKCNYHHKDKVVVVNHLASHGVKAYKCTVCGYATNYRSSAYRHIKGKHFSDNISLCRTSIKYVKDTFGLNSDFELKDSPVYLEQDIDTGSQNTENEEADFDATEAEPNSFIDTYRCTVCDFKANWRSSVCRHIRNAHNTNDYTGLLEGTRRYFSGETKDIDIVCMSSEKKEPNMRTPIQSVSSEPEHDESPEKKHKCNICPYRASKPTLLKFHMSCHKPQPGVQQEKCKFCPYYVVAKRLLHQHMRLHMKDMHIRQKEAAYQKSATPVKKASIFNISSPGSVTPKKFRCNICPYSTNSKNDMMYHKQFHRQRPSCDYKCEHCDYWVAHKRLLRQHMKVHDISPSPALSTSVHSSPAKSDMTESSAIHDTVQLAMYKQRMISAKITPSISQKPVMSPMKIACSVGNRPGYALKNGVYRKLHRCEKCPYVNVRLRNLRLHRLMHGNNRKSKAPLQKCPHCDYAVGSKGLLSHHLKVHQPDYMLDIKEVAAPDSTTNGNVYDEGADSDDGNSDTLDITMESKADALFEIAKFKKYSCEKCPYASAKRSHYERHVSLHGSKQRCQCTYCDYSVQSNNLLAQHLKLHMSPNQNLLAVQSLSNLQLLEEVPADVALASALPPLDRKGSFTVSITHDHLDLYENSPELDTEPKKLYRCDRCPYANVRRDHLLAHLKFHMIKSELVCPYCDYSVAKQHLLTQHIRVHFCPLPELSNWLAQNGEIDRVKHSKDPDISEALFVAELFRTDINSKSQAAMDKSEEDPMVTNDENKEEKLVETGEKEESLAKTTDDFNVSVNTLPSTSAMPPGERKENDEETTPDDENEKKEEGKESLDEYVCQYCDREFPSSDLLVKHEMQHLIGNNFEEYMAQIQQLAEVSDEEEGEEDIEAEEDIEEEEEEADEEEEDIEAENEDLMDGDPIDETTNGRISQSSQQSQRSEEAQETFSGNIPSAEEGTLGDSSPILDVILCGSNTPLAEGQEIAGTSQQKEIHINGESVGENSLLLDDDIVDDDGDDEISFKKDDVMLIDEHPLQNENDAMEVDNEIDEKENVAEG